MAVEEFLQEIRLAGERSPADLVTAIEAYCREDTRIRFYDYEVNGILEKCVAEAPSEFLVLADRINEIRAGEIVSGFGYGLRKAVTEKKIVEPGGVATLLKRVAQQLHDGVLAFTNPEAHWPTHAYIDLLREASRQDEAWRTIDVHRTLLEAASLFIGVADSKSGMIVEHSLEPGADWLAHSLNSDHGLLGYAICFLASVAVEESDANQRVSPDWNEQEARALGLLELVLARKEPNYLRVAFGSLIPFMLIRRRPWFDDHWATVFPDDPALWEASWSSYIMPRQRWDKVYQALEPEYIRSIERTRALIAADIDIRDGEWHRIPGEDTALFWQLGTIQGDNRVLRYLIERGPDVLLNDMVDVLRHTIETDKAPPERAAELVKLIQDVRVDDREGSKSYWTRLQILFDRIPARYWLGELRPSLENDIAIADQIYVDLLNFLDESFAIDPKATTDILMQIRFRANDVPWFFMWSRVRPLLEEWRDRTTGEVQGTIDSILRTSTKYD